MEHITRRGIMQSVAKAAVAWGGLRPIDGAAVSCPGDPVCDFCGGVPFRGIRGTCETDADCSTGCRCGPSAGKFMVKLRVPKNPTKKERRRFRRVRRRNKPVVKLFCEPETP